MSTRPSALTLYDRASAERRAQIRAYALARPCATCGAKAGEKCHGSAGKPAQPHWIRRRGA